MTILTAILLALAQGDPASPSLEARVDSWAVQLRDEGTRDRARDRLIHLGRPGLTVLERLDVDPTILASIRREVVENEAIGASYGPPHFFSFDGSEQPLGVLLSRLETGAGVTFHKNSLDLSQRVSVLLPEATFWEAFDEICRKAAIWYFPGEQFYLNGGMASPQPRAYFGPFMIIMERVIQQRKITFEKIESDYLIRLMCVWENTVAPLGPTGRYTLSQVTDDTGASLLPRERPASVPRPLLNVRMVGQRIDLQGLTPPTSGAKKLAIVRGTLELEFPARIDEVKMEISADAPAAAREIQGAKVELKNFAPSSTWGASAEFQIRFKDPKEASTFRIASTDLEFVTGGNGPSAAWISAAQRDSDQGIFSFTALWRHGGRQELPKEIRLRIPRGSLIKNIPFCYRDVDLK